MRYWRYPSGFVATVLLTGLSTGCGSGENAQGGSQAQVAPSQPELDTVPGTIRGYYTLDFSQSHFQPCNSEELLYVDNHAKLANAVPNRTIGKQRTSPLYTEVVGVALDSLRSDEGIPEHYQRELLVDSVLLIRPSQEGDCR